MPRLIKNNWGKVLLLIAVFSAGIFIGITIKDFPLFSLDTKVGVSDLANLILAVVVAFLIPISLSPILANKRVMKDFLIGETKECLLYLSSIKELIDSLAVQGNSKKEDRARVNLMISRVLSLKMLSLRNQLERSFKNESVEMRRAVNDAYVGYWQETTGGELMADKFKFDIRFSLSHDKSFIKLQECLKGTVHEINNY